MKAGTKCLCMSKAAMIRFLMKDEEYDLIGATLEWERRVNDKSY
jgi:hypothetical protein